MIGPITLRWRRVAIAALAVAAIICASAPAQAQSKVRVNSDRTTIWGPTFAVALAVVGNGTVLDVVGKSGTWYEVTLPFASAATGFVAMSRVTALDNTPVPTRDARSGPGRRAPAAPAKVPALAPRLFVQAGYGLFAAKDTFDAVLGSRGGAWFGGGLQVTTSSGVFFEGAVDRFQKTGSRVFVLDGEVFDLGVDDKVRIIPVTGSVGYRFGRSATATPYASVGAGRTFLKETSPGATKDENVSSSFNVYQAIVGVELFKNQSAALAFEAQYSTAPDALDAGAALLFDERDLGGLQFRVKLLFGR